jgi:TonB-dependent SusC/RagA subfamily outer membrane receptor
MRLKFKWIYTLLLALSMQFSFAQEKTVSGVVSDGTGPVPGVNVIVRGTKNGVQTDFDGKYAIKAKVGDVLIFSFVGMNDSKATVGTSNQINIKLQSGVNLKEVVVQGYRTVTKKQAVVSDATVSSKTIENRPNANVMNTLQGQLAGVNITASTGQPGAKSTVIIRGVGTITGNSDPLYVIDGFPSNSDNFRSINPNDIESTSVLKDAAAIAEYGNRGSNGVIVIKTKKAQFGESKTTFRYSSQYGVGELQNPKYEYATAQQLLKIEKARGAGKGI